MKPGDAELERPMASDDERMAGPLVLSAVVPLTLALIIETTPALIMTVARLIDRESLLIIAPLSLVVSGWGWFLRGQLRGLVVIVARAPFVVLIMVTLGMLSESAWNDTCIGSDTIDSGCVRSAERWFEIAFAGATAIPLLSSMLLWRSERESY